MKQLVQHLHTGKVCLEDVPIPAVLPGTVLIQTTYTLVSAGTERMLLRFGRGNYLEKARQQPERVLLAWQKIQTDGLRATVRAIRERLNRPQPLGYCQSGVVLAVGDGVTGLRIGMRVVSNGPHAEVVCVPQNLVVPIPENVSDTAAPFGILGAVALHSIRQLGCAVGETVAVIGLGLVGLLTADLLRTGGYQVIGVEVNPARIRLARSRGHRVLDAHYDAVVASIREYTNGHGADGVIMATAAGSGRQVLSQAAAMCRSNGKLMLVGVTDDVIINRTGFYTKELAMQVARSYGFGRYDSRYEHGQDYPYALVRWTAQRNIEAVLHYLSSGQVDVSGYTSEVVPIADFARVYEAMTQKPQPSAPLATLFSYPATPTPTPIRRIAEPRVPGSKGVVGMIGAGQFATGILLPALKKTPAALHTLVSANGLTAVTAGRTFGFLYAEADVQAILKNPDIDLCVIATRHDSHARLTVEALQAGKHVFVEKPLALSTDELTAIVAAQQAAGRLLMVGFNRRFSSFALKMKALLGGSETAYRLMNVVVTVNAGQLPPDAWQNDPNRGGGRLVGEGCHFIDFVTFLTGSRVSAVLAHGSEKANMNDSVTIGLRYENGSTGTIHYFTNGSRAYAKERIEVYAQERTLILENFQNLNGFGFRGFSRMRGSQDKGHKPQLQAVIKAVQTGHTAELIPLQELINTTQATLAVPESLRQQAWIPIHRNL